MYPHDYQPGLQTATAHNPPGDILKPGMGQTILLIHKLLQDGKLDEAKAILGKEMGDLGKHLAMMEAAAAGNATPMATGYGMPDPEAILCKQTEVDQRRPIIFETRLAPDVHVAPGAGFVRSILNQVFPKGAARRFFLADNDDYRAQVLGRVLVGLGFQWKLTAVTLGDAPRVWDARQLEPLKDALMECQFAVYRSSSSEPWINTQPLEHFRDEGREDGKQLPTSLVRGATFHDKQAHVRLLPPDPLLDLNNHEGVPVEVQAACCVRALFVDPEFAPDYFGATKE